MLHDASEPVYIAFFTLTGARLQLSALLPDLPAAGLIFTLRLLGIFVGSRLGGAMGGAERAHRDRYWMALVTQAGVTLGLLAQTSKMFPWAQDIATAVTATVVMNQLVGPLLYRTAILSVGEVRRGSWPLQDIVLLLIVCARVSSFHSSSAPASPTLLQYYCTAIGQNTTPPSTSLWYAIHHTILAITISCKGQGAPGHKNAHAGCIVYLPLLLFRLSVYICIYIA